MDPCLLLVSCLSIVLLTAHSYPMVTYSYQLVQTDLTKSYCLSQFLLVKSICFDGWIPIVVSEIQFFLLVSLLNPSLMISHDIPWYPMICSSFRASQGTPRAVALTWWQRQHSRWPTLPVSMRRGDGDLRCFKYPLVMTNIAIEMAIEIVDLPIENGDFP